MQNDYRVYDYELRREVIPAGQDRARQGKAPLLAGRTQAKEEVAGAA